MEEELESVDWVGRSFWAGLVEGLGKKEENLNTAIMRQSVSNPESAEVKVCLRMKCRTTTIKVAAAMANDQKMARHPKNSPTNPKHAQQSWFDQKQRTWEWGVGGRTAQNRTDDGAHQNGGRVPALG